MIKKFRKKPVTIEAIRLLNNDDSIEECIEWVFKIGMETSLIGKSATIDDVKDKGGFYIPTLEGNMKANIGDYIIKGINGEFYPCKPDIFDKTYEKVTEYRIKPEPKYRPFKDAEECWTEMQKHQSFGWTKLIGAIEYSFITDVDDNTNYSGAIKEYTFADGTPFGIKEE